MADIRLVNFRKDRLEANCKLLLSDVCDHIENNENNIAGFGIVTWDDRGNSNTSYLSGGPVGSGILPSFVKEKLEKLIMSCHIHSHYRRSP